jgi:hypothetical protein
VTREGVCYYQNAFHRSQTDGEANAELALYWSLKCEASRVAEALESGPGVVRRVCMKDG